MKFPRYDLFGFWKFCIQELVLWWSTLNWPLPSSIPYQRVNSNPACSALASVSSHCSVSGKAREDSPSTRPLLTTMETWMEFLTLWVWPDQAYFSHLGNEREDEKSLSSFLCCSGFQREILFFIVEVNTSGVTPHAGLNLQAGR